MKITDQVDYLVCTDCMWMVEYGEELEDNDGQDREELLRVAAAEHNTLPNDFVRGDYHTEFSSRRCEICNALAGERHGITLLLRG